MDSKNKAIIVVAVVIVLIVAVFAAQNLNKDKNDDKDETATVTFLIEDNYGVYFWIDGEGKTVFDALKDAVDDYDIPFTESTGIVGVGSLFGIETKEVDGTWVWWQQFAYTDGAWVSNEVTMDQMPAKDNKYIGICYCGFGDTPTFTDVSKAAVWDWSMGDTLFTIESYSGMYFRVGGIGDTVFDAWENAMKTYNVPYVPSDSSYGKGVTSIFGIDGYSDETGYTYWDQYVVDGTEWISAPLMMSNLKSADYSQMLIVFGNFYSDNHPEKAPIYI